MLTDIEIAEGCKLRDIREIAKKLNIGEDNLELYGKYKAKINLDKVNPKSKLILVTAINPTASGEGKTTVSIGLADGMAKLGKKVCLALREPSLGPVFGIKGGAAGGGQKGVLDVGLFVDGNGGCKAHGKHSSLFWSRGTVRRGNCPGFRLDSSQFIVIQLP